MNLILVVSIILTAFFGFVIFLFLYKNKSANHSTINQDLKNDLVKLSLEITNLKESVNSQISDRLDRNQAVMLNSLQKQFSESSKLVGDVTKSLTELKESNKQVVSITDELKTLQNVLQNPKQRGVLGEYYLKSVLDNVLSPNGYQMQYHIGKNNLGQELICDAAIFLDQGLILPVDSKFSLENYNRLIEEKAILLVQKKPSI